MYILCNAFIITLLPTTHIQHFLVLSLLWIGRHLLFIITAPELIHCRCIIATKPFILLYGLVYKKEQQERSDPVLLGNKVIKHAQSGLRVSLPGGLQSSRSMPLRI